MCDLSFGRAHSNNRDNNEPSLTPLVLSGQLLSVLSRSREPQICFLLSNHNWGPGSDMHQHQSSGCLSEDRLYNGVHPSGIHPTQIGHVPMSCCLRMSCVRTSPVPSPMDKSGFQCIADSAMSVHCSRSRHGPPRGAASAPGKPGDVKLSARRRDAGITHISGPTEGYSALVG